MMGHKFSPEAHGLVGVYDVFRDRFVISEDHTYVGPNTIVFVKDGYACDGASVPRFLWWLFPRFGRYARAALFHDELYERRTCSRPIADGVFLQIMRVDKVPAWKRFLLYVAVRLGGWWSWYGCQRWLDRKLGRR